MFHVKHLGGNLMEKIVDKLITENAMLICENSELKSELYKTRDKIHRLEGVIDFLLRKEVK